MFGVVGNFGGLFIHSPVVLVGFGYLAVSLLTVLAYGWDKRQARLGRWRIPERRLHLLELLGGWPGAWLAQHRLRHKNRKRAYQWRFRAIVVLHLLCWGLWFWRLLGLA